MKKSAIFMVLGIIVFAVYLIFFIGIDQIVEVSSKINSMQFALFYSLAILAMLGSVFFWSAAWNTILRQLQIHVSYRRAYLYYWVGYFADLVIPCATVCGEVTRLYLVQKETQENYGALAAAAVTNRIVAYIIVTIGLYSGGALILLKPGVSAIITNIFVTFIIGVTVYLAVLLYLALDKRAARNITRLYLRLLKIFRPKSYQLSHIEKTRKSLEEFYEGFKTFRENRRLLFRPLILHLTSYLLGLAVYILVFYALGIPSANPEFYVVIFFIATAVQDAVASFSVGSLDILLATILLFYGINPGVSGIAAAVLRSVGFWLPLLAGLICVQVLGARNLVSTHPENLRRRLKRSRKQAATIVKEGAQESKQENTGGRKGRT